MEKLLFVILFSTASLAHSQSRRTENLFIITLDGLRWQEVFTGADSALIVNQMFVKDPVGLNTEFWADTPEERRERLMPFFWETIANEGQLYGNRNYSNYVNVSNTMWFSYPGYNEILCGYSDDARIRTNNKILNPNTTVLEFLNRELRFKGKVAAFGSWDVFPYIINEERSGVPVNAGFERSEGKEISSREAFLNELQGQIPSPWATVRLDAFTHHYAIEYLKRRAPKVVFISYGETDDFAHDGKYDAYLRSANQTDAFIEDLWTWVQGNSDYRNKTTFLITTDHGRGTIPLDAWKNHDSKISGADEIWIAVIGPDTPALGEVKRKAQLYQKQIAKTAAAFLGVQYKSVFPVGETIVDAIKK